MHQRLAQLGTSVFISTVSVLVFAQDPLLPKPSGPGTADIPVTPASELGEPPAPEISETAIENEEAAAEAGVPLDNPQPQPIAEASPEPEEPATMIKSSVAQPTALSLEEVPPYADSSEVEVENPVVVETKKDCDCDDKSPGTPYRERRETFGYYVGFQSGTYLPKNYVPDFVSGQLYEDYFESKSFSLMEAVITFKWNTSMGGLGVTATAGAFRSGSKNERGALTTNPLTAGASYYADTLFSEPYVVPYVTGGLYTVFYKETLADQSVEGRTPFRAFYAAGLAFQLDWLDKDAHFNSYKDFGLEGTYLFVEARQFMSSSAEDNPDLSTAMHFNAGIKFEF